MFTKLILAVLLRFVCSSSIAENPSDPSTLYTGAQVLKILNTNRKVMDELIHGEDMDLWGHNRTHADIMVPSDKVKAVKDYLKVHHVPFTVMINDVQALIESDKNVTFKEVAYMDQAVPGGSISLHKYQRLSTIDGYLSFLAAAYPDTVSEGVLGYSWEGRAIKYIKISSGKLDANAVFIDAGIHAREWISPATALYAIRELVERRSSLPKELLALDFYIVVVLNPDGYEYTHTTERLWRKNRSKRGPGCQGIDLNRNFDFHWAEKGTSNDECSLIYPGPAPFSEPETLALAHFLHTVHNLKAYISLHSYSQLLLLPYGYDKVRPPDFDELLKVADLAAAAMIATGGEFYEVGNTAEILYAASGSSFDWVKGVLGVKYSYTFELRDTGRYGFLLPANQIIPTGKEFFEALKVIALAALTS